MGLWQADSKDKVCPLMSDSQKEVKCICERCAFYHKKECDITRIRNATELTGLSSQKFF